MPVLDAAVHLNASLGSLVGQRFRDFEIVIVDGGSSDHTPELAASLLRAHAIDHRIEVLPGSGIYQAMNHGVSMAKGAWLYFLGSDDRLVADDVFERIASVLLNVSPQTLLVHGDVWIEAPGYRYGQPWTLPRLLDRNLSHQSAFYRRVSLVALGIVYDARYPLYADWDYNLHVLSRGRYHYVPILIASYACSGKSSQNIDALFMAEKEARALAYFGWRSLWRLPPDRFALAIKDRPGLGAKLALLVNRLVWLMRRWRPSRDR